MTDPRIFFPNQPIQTPRASTPAITNRNGTPNIESGTFQKILDQSVGGVKFSQHAQQRLRARNIQLDNQQIAQLGAAVDKAAQKGARESLVLMNRDLALVVSVTNRTVITAMDGNSIRDNVFTNIDSAVII
jgi:flagellar operon protein